MLSRTVINTQDSHLCSRAYGTGTYQLLHLGFLQYEQIARSGSTAVLMQMRVFFVRGGDARVCALPERSVGLEVDGRD